MMMLTPPKPHTWARRHKTLPRSASRTISSAAPFVQNAHSQWTNHSARSCTCVVAFAVTTFPRAPGRRHLQAALGAPRLGQEGDAVLRRKVLHQLPQREVGLLRLRPAAACSLWHRRFSLAQVVQRQVQGSAFAPSRPLRFRGSCGMRSSGDVGSCRASAGHLTASNVDGRSQWYMCTWLHRGWGGWLWVWRRRGRRTEGGLRGGCPRRRRGAVHCVQRGVELRADSLIVPQVLHPAPRRAFKILGFSTMPYKSSWACTS
jgi:hypothetical protein